MLMSVVCMLVHAGSLWAQSLSLNDLVVDNTNGTMTVHYGVRIKGISSIERALSQGLHLRFSGQAALYKKRTLWWDDLLVDNDFTCDLWEDPLKQEAVLSLDGEEIRFPMADFAQVFQKRLEHMVTSLGPWNVIQKGRTYIVRLSLTLTRIDVPAWIRVPLFFWSWDLAPETRFEMEFAY